MRARLEAVLAGAAVLAALLPACAPAATSTPPPVLPTVTPEPLPTSTPTLVPVALRGPGDGSRMTWVDASTLIYVPAGPFTMGTGVGDAPEHEVSLAAYWIQQTEVTNRMYAQCVSAGVCAPPAQELGGPVYSNPDFGNHPVVGVTWDQAQSYCGWVQGRLPTEAEWEKLARGTAGDPYPWGIADPNCDLLNSGYCLGHTTEVTAYDAGMSPFGAFDTAGNVFEWVADWYGEGYYNEASLNDPAGPESGEFRVIRGSSFESDPDQILSGIRHPAAPAYHNRDTGFRCAVPEPKPLAPYCQLSPYVPTGAVGADTCELPAAAVRGQYCANNFGYATIDLPDGAVYQVPQQDFKCTEAIVDGQRRLTCEGPRAREVTDEITVCNPTCSNSPDISGAAPVCDPGYTLAAGTGACNYTPILSQPGVAGCPPGYVSVDRGSQKQCVAGVGPSGLCPQGTYLDSLYGACVPANGQAEAPFGIDNPELAQQTYQGCADGYTYDETFQCCQPQSGGTYPGCTPGAAFDPEIDACSPGGVKLSGPGCITLPVTILDCGVPADVCKRIKSEAHCIQNSYACTWLEAEGVCVLK